VYKQQTAEAITNGDSNCPFCAIGHDANKSKMWVVNDIDTDHVVVMNYLLTTMFAYCTNNAFNILCETVIITIFRYLKS